MPPKPPLQFYRRKSAPPPAEPPPPAETNQAPIAAIPQIHPPITGTSSSSPVDPGRRSHPASSSSSSSSSSSYSSSSRQQRTGKPPPGSPYSPHTSRRPENRQSPLPPPSFGPQRGQEQPVGSPSSASPPLKTPTPHRSVPNPQQERRPPPHQQQQQQQHGVCSPLHITGQQRGSPNSPYTSRRPEIGQSPLPSPSFTPQGAQQQRIGSRSSASPPVKIPSPHRTVTKTPSPSPQQQQEPGASSSTTRGPNAPDETLLADSFLQILRGFTIPGEKAPLYKAQVESLVRRGTPELVVNFEHVLTNMELAIKIASSDSSYIWLQSVLRTFLDEECREMRMEEKKKFLQAARVSFINKPDCVISLKDVKINKEDLVKAITIMRGQESCTAASTFGREVYLAILIFVFGKHRNGESWNGQFAEEHVYFFRYSGRLLECRIMKNTEPGPAALSARDVFNPQQCTPEERKKDAANIDALLTDSYRDAEGNLPVYFEDLHYDLLRAPASVIIEEWFMQNLEYDLALMPSIARKILTSGIHNAIRSLKLDLVEEYKRILQEAPFPTDWRPLAKAMEGIMKSVYWFKNEEEDESKDQYKDTMESAVGYKRHAHEHCHQHLDGEKRLDDVDEGELFTAVKIPGVLAKLVKNLMKLNMMGGGLAAVREAYCASRANQKEPASEKLYVQELEAENRDCERVGMLS